MDWLSIGAAFLMGLFGSLVGWFLLNGYFWADLQQVKRQVNAAWANQHTGSAVAAKDAELVEIQAAMAEASQIVQGEADGKTKGAQMLQLAVRYPRAASRLMREIKKAGLLENMGLGQFIK